MSVLKGEGKISILYGPTRLPIGRNLPVYLSRPDAVGSHPTVVVAHGAGGITASVKAVCRRLARYGFAAICPDLYRGELVPGDPAAAFAALANSRLRADLLDVFETADMPGTEWSDAGRLAVLALGDGAHAAAATATTIPAGGIALIDPPFGDAGRLEGLGDGRTRVLAIVGGEGVAEGALDAVRSRIPSSEWVVYPGQPEEFANEAAPGFDHDAAEAAWARVIGFLESVTAAS